MKYEIKFTTQFKKDLKYRDHDLTGNYISYRECHVEPDWLLVYKKVM
ncbi:MAG: type II toxin-antitoxin system YafQ family toxin [Lachnospiraceae bacterium]|nr:type II toxin-antitoxin system YafQ family toxin [Lachnospiraceae bacterium]